MNGGQFLNARSHLLQQVVITLELDLLVVNYHKVHPQSCGDTSFNFVLCIHELQLKGLECKKVFFFRYSCTCINERKIKKGHLSHLFVHMLCNDDMCYMERFRYGTGPKSQINGYRFLQGTNVFYNRYRNMPKFYTRIVIKQICLQSLDTNILDQLLNYSSSIEHPQYMKYNENLSCIQAKVSYIEDKGLSEQGKIVLFILGYLYLFSCQGRP